MRNAAYVFRPSLRADGRSPLSLPRTRAGKSPLAFDDVCRFKKVRQSFDRWF